MEVLNGLDIPLYLLLLPLVALLLYLYGTWPYGQWKSLGIDGPAPEPFYGNLRQMTTKGFPTMLWEWPKKYGRTYGNHASIDALDMERVNDIFVTNHDRVFRIYKARSPVLVTSDLDILKEVLVKDFLRFSDRLDMPGGMLPEEVRSTVMFSGGVEWKRMRSIITPTFSSGKLKLMENFISECAADLADNLKQVAERRGKVDIKEYTGAFTMDVIAGTAFGLRVNSQQDRTEPFLSNMKDMIDRAAKIPPYMTLFFVLPFLTPLLKLFVRFSWFTSMQFFFDAVTKMIDERKQEKSEGKKRHVDFLQLMIDAEASEEEVKNGTVTATEKRLARKEILGHAVLFFFAGYDTTSAALQFFAYAMALNQNVQQTIYREIKEQLGDDEPTYENVGKLKYLEHAIYEALRMYPPVPLYTRKASETVTIKGVTIPKGSGVMVPVCDVVRDPEYFPDPEKFIPERWERASKNDIAFLTFGFGPRQCIGMRLALLEIKMAAVHMLKAVKFNKTPDLPEKLSYRGGGQTFLRPASPIMLQVQLRQDTNTTVTLSNGKLCTRL